MRTRTMRFRTVAVIALALAAPLAACAGDDTRTIDDPAATDGSTTDDPASDETDVAGGSDEPTGSAIDDTSDDSVDDTGDDTSDDVSVDVPDDMPDDMSDDTSGDTALPESDELDPEEVAGLLWMREEEQMAHDVYVALGEEYGLRVFENIARSEQQHIEMTIGLLDRYDLPDVAAGNEPGTFTDPAMQDLYDDLIAQGMQSKVDALIVGATIEELDIADLRARAEITDEPEIDDVYARLEQASGNHLRAFVGQLDVLDVEYEPTVLDDVDEIVAAPMRRGRSGDH